MLFVLLRSLCVMSMWSMWERFLLYTTDKPMPNVLQCTSYQLTDYTNFGVYCKCSNDQPGLFKATQNVQIIYPVDNFELYRELLSAYLQCLWIYENINGAGKVCIVWYHIRKFLYLHASNSMLSLLWMKAESVSMCSTWSRCMPIANKKQSIYPLVGVLYPCFFFVYTAYQ